MRIPATVLGAAGALAFAAAAQASLVNLGPGSFTPAASVITFSEPGRSVGDTDPIYSIAGNTISFGEYFLGHTVIGGAVRTLTGAPTTPLSLVQNGRTFITNDGANPTSPVLSGTPLFNGPISFTFSTPVAAVGLSGGYFDAVGATTIEAFDAAGLSLGSIVNSAIGVEFYGLFDSSGSNIAGVSFYITGSEPAGFAIDTRAVQTEVLVENGGTVVIGGIYEQFERNRVNKVPLLGDIPYLGYLFKNTSRTNDRTELLVFLTPRVVTDVAAAR